METTQEWHTGDGDMAISKEAKLVGLSVGLTLIAVQYFFFRKNPLRSIDLSENALHSHRRQDWNDVAITKKVGQLQNHANSWRESSEFPAHHKHEYRSFSDMNFPTNNYYSPVVATRNLSEQWVN
jgi:hypothetical protein